jgi:putative ABC transport system permease protein
MMIANYLKSALRNATGSALYSIINISGLSIGLACCLLILLFVRHELSYESAFANADRIYRVSREIYPFQGARARVPAMNNWPIGEVLPNEFSEIESMGRVYGGGMALIAGELTFNEAALRFGDATIPRIFGFQWLAGDPATALAEPYSVVLTEALACKYFGTVDAVGQTLDSPSFQQDLRVTGVMRDLPRNTHVDITGLVSLVTITEGANGNPFAQNWNNNTDFHTYVLLREGATTAAIEARVPEFLERYAGEGVSQLSTLRFMNIRDIHLRSDRDEEWKQPGSIDTIYGFAGVAFSILLIACINFISISTARSSQRAREVGVRRAIGASRRELVVQFLGESTLTTLVSIALALVIVELALPAFGAFTGIDFSFAAFTAPGILIVLAALTLFTAVAAGSYPAFFLANLGSGRMLHGHMTRDAAGLRFRNALVVIQFAIAISLVIATAVIYLQRQYASRIDLGFERNGIVVVENPQPGGFGSDWTAFKQNLLNDPAIENVTTSHYLPFGFNDNQMPVSRSGLADPVRIQYMMTDYDFFETFDMQLVAGRIFTPEFPGDVGKLRSPENPDVSTGFVLNAAAARALGFQPQESLDEQLRIPFGGPYEMVGPVVGVVNDTYFESIRSAVRPMVYIVVPPTERLRPYSEAAIRVRSAAMPAALAHIEQTWRELYPGQTFSWHYLADDFEALYVAEDRQGTLLLLFSILAVLIACFGLFGLASFNAERRTKEIGVRKVMGGSVFSIVLLLTNDFSKLVLLANLIAWPLAYFAMNRWLENFAYRIDLTPLVFIGSGLIALCIAWATVGGTAAKAANARPVLALRYE